jgi:hypothetical protein
MMPMDNEKSAHTPTFAMLMEPIAADPDLSDTRKDPLLCSIRCYTKLLVQDPTRMTVELAGYSDAIGKFRPARHKIKKSRWANICTDMRAALRYAGIEGVPGRNLTPPSRAWLVLLATVSVDRSRSTLTRFARWATDLGFEP